MLDELGLRDAKAGYDLVRRNILGAAAQALRSMATNAGTIRGGFTLCGIDVLLDHKLRAFVLETNIDPELSIDRIRRPISVGMTSSMFRLLAETHRKTAHLYDGGCHSTRFSPVGISSPAGQAMMETEVPEWTLLYSEAVEPPYAIVDELGGASRETTCFAQ